MRRTVMLGVERMNALNAELIRRVNAGENIRQASIGVGISYNQAKKTMQRYRKATPAQEVAPTLDYPTIIAQMESIKAQLAGEVSATPQPSRTPESVERLYREAAIDYSRTVREQRKVARITSGRPHLLVVFSDQHLGNVGTDIRRCFEDASKVAALGGGLCSVILGGDARDNFITPKLAKIRHHTKMSVTQEEELEEEYLRILFEGGVLRGVLPGNHGRWTVEQSGHDPYPNLLRALGARIDADHVAYGPEDEIEAEINVQGARFLAVVRHHWQGNTTVNPVGGIIRSLRFGRSFDLGVGGHIHGGTLWQTINRGPDKRPAIGLLCGSYKRIDKHAIIAGYPAAPDAPAAAVLIADGALLPFSDLDLAIRVLRGLL